MNAPIRLCVLVFLSLILWRAPALSAATLEIAKRDCRRLAVHLPAPGVAYEAGKDVRGRPVVSADLDGAPKIVLPEIIAIEIEADLQDRFGFPANANSFEADARIGTVEVAPDGTARFNGQPLQDEAQADLARRCQQILYGRPQAARP